MQCSTAHGKMSSPLFSAALQNRFTACIVSLQLHGEAEAAVRRRCGLSLSKLWSNATTLQPHLPSDYIVHCKQGLAGCTSFASTDCKACSTSKLLVSCENALANNTLLSFTMWILGKAGLFLQTALSFRGLVAYGSCLLHNSEFASY
jgi:hypothetical protein